MHSQRDIFINVLEAHKGIIYKIVHAYCRQETDQQDLIQEIILQLWLSFGRYDPQFKYSTWIYRIALNTAISFYRKNKARRERTLGLSPLLATSVEAQESLKENPDAVLLHRFIQELRELDKALILLYLDELSHKEIAGIMGLTPTNVSTKIARIKQQLKQKFQTEKSNDHAR